MAKRKTYIQKYNELLESAENKIQQLIERKGKQSKFCSDKALIIKNDNLMFNLDDCRYLVAISKRYLIDCEGYLYSHNQLSLEQMCEIIDSF